MPVNRPRPTPAGFTLVELITVLVLISVLAGIGVFIVRPFIGASDLSRRAELVDQAQITLELMAEDIRVALPNSVRTGVDGDGDLVAVEIVTTRTGGRYRRLPAPAPGGGGDRLNRAQSGGTFDALGGLPAIGNVVTGSAGIDCGAGTGDCINIFNTSDDQFNIYEGDNIAKITGFTDNGQPATKSDQITYDTGTTDPAFQAHSPNQRFFVLDDVVSFVCNTNTNELRRFDEYGLDGAQQIPPGGTSRLMARDVYACDFTYKEGASTRSGLVTLDITIKRDGESVDLLKQVHVQNAP